MSIIGFPLLILPLAIYFIVELLLPGLRWQDPVTHVAMVSGVVWTMTLGDLLIAGALALLILEITKATRMSRRSIVDHVLSLAVFIGMLVAFLIVEKAATGTFFLLLAIAFVDVIAGFVVAVRTAQRDIAVAPAAEDA